MFLNKAARNISRSFFTWKGDQNMFRRYIKQLVNSLFSRDTATTRSKETEIERQIARLKQIQRTHKQRQRPRKKDAVL